MEQAIAVVAAELAPKPPPHNGRQERAERSTYLILGSYDDIFKYNNN
jgi:hypothetical protein